MGRKTDVQIGTLAKEIKRDNAMMPLVENVCDTALFSL